jgi:hypothetical protein
MNPLFLCPKDTIKLTESGLIDHTLSLLESKGNKDLDDSESFLKTLPSLPKGTVLEVSQLYIRSRAEGGNSVTFRIVDGPICSDFNKQLAQSQIDELQDQIRSLKVKRDQMGSESTKAKTEVIYDIKNREKRIKALSVKDSKNIYSKLIKISLTDIESWSIKPTSVNK